MCVLDQNGRAMCVPGHDGPVGGALPEAVWTLTMIGVVPLGGNPHMATDDQPAVPAATADPADEELTGEALVRWWRVPLSLRIVAYAFILVGVLGVENMLLRWFVFHDDYVDISFVGIFIGWGLLRWRDSSRRWAVFFTWPGLFFAAIWLIGTVLYLMGGSGGIVGLIGTSLRGALLAGCILGYLVWQLRVLRRPDIVARFKAPRLERLLAYGGRDPAAPHGRWQFSLGGLLVMTAIVAFAVARIGASDVLYDPKDVHPSSTSQVGAGGVQLVDYGYQTARWSRLPDRLLYVVMASGEGPSIQILNATDYDARLVSPDGKPIPLSSGPQLYEIVDGELRSRDERVTLDELQDFLHSNPDEWSLEALIRHAEQMRGKQAAAKSPADHE